MKINFAEIISAGTNYMDARNTFKSKYPNGGYITHESPDMYDAYRYMEKYEAVLDSIACTCCIPASAIVAAARIESRYYDRYKGTRTVDYQRLLESLS